MTLRRAAVLLAAVALLLPGAAACNANGDETEPPPTETPTAAATDGFTPSPAETEEATPEITATPRQRPAGAATPLPPLTAPAVPAGYERLGEGTTSVLLDPEGATELHPELLPRRAPGVPDCSRFTVFFSWRVLEPSPPTGVDLLWRIKGGEELGEGPAGTATAGCNVLEAVNGSEAPVHVVVYYVATHSP